MYQSLQNLEAVQQVAREAIPLHLMVSSPPPSARRRRSAALTVLAITAAVIATFLCGCGGTASGPSSAPTSGTDAIVAPNASSDQVSQPADGSSSNSGNAPDTGSGSDASPGGLTPQDTYDICAGGAVCDPSSSGPPYVDGGGLALPDGGS